MTTTAAVARPAQTGIGRSLLVGLIAGLVAGVADTIVFFIGQAMGLPFLVPMGGPGSPPAALPPFAIIAAATVPALVAGVLYWALGRFTKRATAIFVGAAVVFTLLSFFPPLSLPIDLGTRLALVVMHLVTAPIITLGLVRNAPQP